MSAQKQVFVELTEEQQREIKETFGEEYTEMIVHYDQIGRLVGEMIRGGGAGGSFTASVNVTGGVGTSEKAGLDVTGGASGDAQAELDVEPDK